MNQPRWWQARYRLMAQRMEEERRQGGNPDGAETMRPPQTSKGESTHER